MSTCVSWLLVRQHIDCVAWGSSAGTKSGSRAHSLGVHHHVGAGIEKHIVRGSATVNGEANSEITLASFHRQRAPADPSNSGFRANTPRMYVLLGGVMSHAQSTAMCLIVDIEKIMNCKIEAGNILNVSPCKKVISIAGRADAVQSSRHQSSRQTERRACFPASCSGAHEWRSGRASRSCRGRGRRTSP